MNRIRHHPVLSLLVMWFAWTTVSIGLGTGVSKWFFLLILPGFTLYLLGFWWEDKEVLICPKCGSESWNKCFHYCGRCGTRLTFRWKIKVKVGAVAPKGSIPVRACSKGHTVDAFDKFCPKCGGAL